MRGNAKILFVSHEATHTGAVHSLLELIGWLAHNTSLDIRVLCLNGGTRLADFRQLGPTVVQGRSKPAEIRTLLHEVDCIFLNSAASASALPLLAKLGVPVITYIHELSYELGLLPTTARHALVTVATHHIACSEAVANNLHSELGIASQKITTLGEVVSIEKIRNRAQTSLERAGIDERHNLPEGKKLVGAVGTPSWRKGVDLFLSVAADTLTIENNIHFIWIGGGETPDERRRIEFEIDRLGIRDSVTMTGRLDNPYPWMQSLDLLFLCSREDPFPLVMIEAAILDVPMIGFRGSGGFDEFARDYQGRVIPPQNPREAAKAIVEHLSSCATSSAKLDLSALDVEKMAPRFLDVLKGVIDDSASPPANPANSKLAADHLARGYYSIHVRVLENDTRLLDRAYPCLEGAATTIMVDAADLQGRPTRFRLQAHDGPARITFEAVTATTSDGLLESIPVKSYSGGVTQVEDGFIASGYQSSFHFDTPQNTSRVEITLLTARISKISKENAS